MELFCCGFFQEPFKHILKQIRHSSSVFNGIQVCSIVFMWRFSIGDQVKRTIFFSSVIHCCLRDFHRLFWFPICLHSLAQSRSDRFFMISNIQVLWSSLAASDVSPGGTSAPQRQKFHTDDVNQCLHNKSDNHLRRGRLQLRDVTFLFFAYSRKIFNPESPNCTIFHLEN